MSREYAAQATSPDFVADLLKSQGWIVREQTLDAAQGGLQALMAPHEGGFLFVVDPSPTLEEQLAWAGADRKWLSERLVNQRLAHELCHVLFHGHNGRRLVPHSATEEEFCDAFAAALAPIRGAASVPICAAVAVSA
jgi:hypothetical protein